MKIHEYQASEVFQEAGIPVVDGQLVVSAREAISAAENIGYPVVLKAQVLAGGRGKAGGIRVVHSQEELTGAFAEVKDCNIKGYPVEKILVVRAIDIKKEFYIGVTTDHVKNDVVVIASTAGGVDIEDTAKGNPKAIKKFYLQGRKNIDLTRWPEFITAVFETPSHQEAGTKIFTNLIKIFFENDCSLVEINPLVVDNDGQMLAADAKINFDDNALFRHPEIQSMRDLASEDPDEMEAKQNDLSFVKLDGNIGCIVNGAGLAMATMDMIKLSGGDPANFLDVGGSSNPQKVLKALEIILRNKNIKAVLINIFGGITRCDDIAQGIIEAKKQLNITAPLVVRMTGTNERQGKEILAQNGINLFNTMREAVNEAVKISK